MDENKKRQNSGNSQQGPSKKKQQTSVGAPAGPLCGSWVPQLRLNHALVQDTGIKYGKAEHMAKLLIEAGCCRRVPGGTKVELGLYLSEQLRRKLPIEVDQLVPLMVFRGLIKEVKTFKVSVIRIDGKEVDVTLDEELRRLGDLRRELERLEGIPRHTQELYWYAQNGEHEVESVVAEDVTFDKECTLYLCVNKDKPCRPNFVAVLFSVLKKTLDKGKYAELRQLIDTLKQRQSSGSSTDKARGLRHQIMSVVGRATMKQAMADARAEMKLRAARLSKYESLLLHLLDGGLAEEVPPAEQLACRNLSELLGYWRIHRAAINTAAGGGDAAAAGGDDDAHDERVKAMRTILEGATDLRVRALLEL